MQHIGYQLVNKNGTIVDQWGGTFGQCPSIPNPLILPNNAGVIYSARVDVDYESFVLRMWMDDPPLSELKQKARAQVDRDAEAARGMFITLGSGKALSYKQVADEAHKFKIELGSGYYPLLQARVNSGRYKDLESAANSILSIENSWLHAASQIDEIEDRAKLSIDNATTQEEVTLATQIVWPKP
jgi:hypothetical protein